MSAIGSLARIFRRAPVERARAPIPFHADQFVGLTSPGNATHEALLRETLGVAAIATRVIRDRIASLEPVVVLQRRVTAGTIEEEQIDDHPLKQLLDNPSRTHTRAQTLGLIASHVVATGEAYLLKVGRSILPDSLYVMLPGRVEPIAHRGIIDGYRVTDGQGRQETFDAREIVRVWTPDPETLYTAEGILGPQAIGYDAMKFQQSHIRKHFESNAVPPVVFEGQQGAEAPTSDVKDAIDEAWMQSYHQRNGKKAGLPGWVPPGWTAKLIDTFGNSSSGVDLLDFQVKLLMMAYGVPRSIVGDVVDANRAAAETNQYVFDLHTVKPLADLIADCLTMQLASDYPQQDGARLIVRFAEFVAGDKDYELRRQAQALTLKTDSINMIREEQGLDPVEWGDLPVGTFGDQPYTGEEAQPPAQAPANPTDFAPAAAESPRVRLVKPGKSDAVALSPTAIWRANQMRERKWLPTLTARMQRIFAQQRDAALAGLDRVSGRSYDRIKLTDIFDPVAWRDAFRSIDAARESIYREVANSVAAALAARPFVFTQAVKQQLTTDGAMFRDLVNATTGRRLSAILDEATQAGQGVNEIARAIRDEFKMRRKQAVMIARTELGAATSAAQVESFTQSGVVAEQQWNTSQDPFVRDAHQIDGQRVALHGGLFTLADGVRARYPLDPTLPAKDRINCRCFVSPVIQ